MYNNSYKRILPQYLNILTKIQRICQSFTVKILICKQLRKLLTYYEKKQFKTSPLGLIASVKPHLMTFNRAIME